jgi:hypothetical protein
VWGRTRRPHHFEFDSEHKILRLVLKGDLESQEFLRRNAEMHAQAERFQPPAGISDGMAIVNFNVTRQTLRSVAVQGSP